MTSYDVWNVPEDANCKAELSIASQKKFCHPEKKIFGNRKACFSVAAGNYTERATNGW